MSEILQNTGVTLWSIRDDYDELQTGVFETLTGTGGKSNIRLIDEAIGNINSKLNGYYFEYSDDRLYICKKSENENKRYPVTLNDNNGHIASKVDGSTITIDENGIVRGLPVDDALSSISTNPIQNKVVKAKVDEIESSISTLNGDGEGSVKKAVADGITKVVADAPEDFDTLKEMSDWITNHENDASAMNSAIQDNKNAIESLQTGKADKIEIPTTLPANGGNADTVNGHTVDINVPSDAKFTDTTYSDATQIEHGLMSVDDKKKLDGLKKYTPDGTTITADKDGTLHGADTIQVDGITITRDDATKVIALAKTLQDKIALVDNKIDKANVANNLTTTEADFVLDARQGKALQDQLTTLNGSIDTKVNALNPSSAKRSYVYGEIGKEGDGWYRFARITFRAEPSAKGGGSELIEVMINQSYTNSPGCFHKVDFYLKYVDSAIISTIGNNSTVLKKIRMVRNNKTIFIDVYSVGIVNKTKMLLYIPTDFGMDSVECITPYLVPENSDGELIVCSSDLANSI